MRLGRILCASLVTAVLLSSLCITVSAQQNPSLTIKSTTELVLVPVYITHDSQSVNGLKKDDFVLLHNNKPESIALFEEVEAVTAHVSKRPLPKQTVQNFATADEHQDVVILLFDFLNGSWSTAARIRSFFDRIADQLQSSKTPASVLLLSSKGVINAYSFTSDISGFKKALDHTDSHVAPDDVLRKTDAPGWDSLYRETDVNVSGAAIRDYGLALGFIDQLKLDRAEMTVQALEQIAQSFRGVPGRKKLLWFTTGMPRFGDLSKVSEASLGFKLYDKSERAWRALSDSSITIYPIDTNDVYNPGYSGVADINIEVITNTPTLLEAAGRTGGRVCVDTLTTCVRKAVEDAPHYYMLGFYLEKDAKPGWHKLKVKTRKDGLSIRARTGFLIADHLKQPVKEDSDLVLTALASPLDYTSVPLALSWRDIGNNADKREIEVVLDSPPGGISAGSAAPQVNVDILGFARLVRSPDGQTFPASIHANVTPAQLQTLMTSGFRYKMKISLAPGKYELRYFVRDNNTEKIGTVSTPIDVATNSSK